MLVATILCWTAWYTVLVVVNPNDAGVFGHVLFYSTFTLSLMGTLALIGFSIRTVFLKQELAFQKVIISFRQAIFFTLLVDGFLFLQSMRLLTWYNVAFLIFALTVLEFFMISRRPLRHR